MIKGRTRHYFYSSDRLFLAGQNLRVVGLKTALKVEEGKINAPKKCIRKNRSKRPCNRFFGPTFAAPLLSPKMELLFEPSLFTIVS